MLRTSSIGYRKVLIAEHCRYGTRDLSPADLVRLRNLRIASFSGHYGGVNEQPFKLGALIARVTETVKSAPSSAENRGVLVKVIDEHDVAVHIADL